MEFKGILKTIMKKQYKLEENRKVHNIVYLAIITLLIFSLFFSNSISIFLKLKPNYKYNNETEIHFIDVGQGDAIAIKFSNNEVMLIDTGIDTNKDKLFNYLDNIVLFDNTIDYLVLTHIDADHSGNAIDILNEYNVKNIYRPKLNSKIEDNLANNSNEIFDNIISIAKSKSINMIYNQVGVSLKVGLAELTWLSPIGLNLNDKLESNEYSPVIRLDYNGYSALFTGDIGSDTEEILVDTYKNNELDVDILKVAHHGSAYSTSEEFLMATTPKFACISVGVNTYGHPSSKVLERILKYDKSCGTNLYDNIFTTVSYGNVIMSIDDKISVNTIRNIDDYNFVNYSIYVFIAITFLLFFMLLPYMKVFRKNVRFIIQNKKFEKYLKNNNSDAE